MTIAEGYEVHLYYLWLPSPDVAVARVRQRVVQGGHGIPEAVVRRRYLRSLTNLASSISGGVTTWRLYDGGAAGRPRLVTHGGEAHDVVVVDAPMWERVQRSMVEAK